MKILFYSKKNRVVNKNKMFSDILSIKSKIHIFGKNKTVDIGKF